MIIKLMLFIGLRSILKFYDKITFFESDDCDWIRMKK